MGKLLFIDSDDINGLSEALINALSRRGINFGNDTTGEFDYPYDEDDRWLFQESGGSYGGCGGGGYYGGCGSKVNACGSWEAPNVHHSGGSCGDSYYYPRC